MLVQLAAMFWIRVSKGKCGQRLSQRHTRLSHFELGVLTGVRVGDVGTVPALGGQLVHEDNASVRGLIDQWTLAVEVPRQVCAVGLGLTLDGVERSIDVRRCYGARAATGNDSSYDKGQLCLYALSGLYSPLSATPGTGSP